MISLNMLPDVKRQYLKTRRTEAKVVSISLLLMVVCAGILILLAGFVYGAQSLHSMLLTSDINSKMKDIQSIKDISKYVTIQRQLQDVTTLFNQKNDTSRLIEILPQLNPKEPNNVRLSMVEFLESSQSINLSGKASTYSGLVAFRDTLSNAQFTYSQTNGRSQAIALFPNVTIDSQALSSEGGRQSVSFKIIAKYNPAALIHANKDIQITIPNMETTPSKQGTPDIFSGQQTRGQ